MDINWYWLLLMVINSWIFSRIYLSIDSFLDCLRRYLKHHLVIIPQSYFLRRYGWIHGEFYLNKWISQWEKTCRTQWLSINNPGLLFPENPKSSIYYILYIIYVYICPDDVAPSLGKTVFESWAGSLEGIIPFTLWLFNKAMIRLWYRWPTSSWFSH